MTLIELMNMLIQFVFHLEDHLGAIVANYGGWAYGLLFAIVFLETGIVFAPLLPGDSLLFAAGTLAGGGIFNIYILLALLTAAAILGDSCNYFIGEILGKKILRSKNRFIRREYIVETKKFYHKHGSKAIILARFIPIIRTFAPFMAGVGKMDYGKFLKYNIIGGVVWVFTFTLLGYFFGKLPIVQENFSLVVLGIIFISFIPVIVFVVRDLYFKYKEDKMDKKKKKHSKKKTRK